MTVNRPKLSRYHLKWPENFPDVALNFPENASNEQKNAVNFPDNALNDQKKPKTFPISPKMTRKSRKLSRKHLKRPEKA